MMQKIEAFHGRVRQFVVDHPSGITFTLYGAAAWVVVDLIVALMGK